MQEFITPLLLGLALIVVFQLVIASPQKKKIAEQRAAVEALEPGARIMTTFGVFGTVVHLGEAQAIIEVSPGIEMTIAKKAILREVAADEEEFEYADEAAGDEAFEQAIAGFNEPAFDPKADDAAKKEDGSGEAEHPHDTK